MPPRTRRPSRAAVDALVIKGLPIVKQVASQQARRLPKFIDVDDLRSAGAIGLIEAARAFDHRRNDSFRKFARHRIRGAMLDDIRNKDSLSRDMRRISNQLRDATRAFIHTHGREPGAPDLAAATGMTLDEFHATEKKLSGWSVVGLDDADDDFFRRTPDENSPNPFDEAARLELCAALDAAASTLPDRTRAVLAMYYREGWTMLRIGESIGVTESRVCQMLHEAHALMRVELERAGIDAAA